MPRNSGYDPYSYTGLAPLDYAKALGGDAAYHQQYGGYDEVDESLKPSFWTRLRMMGARMTGDPSRIAAVAPEYYAREQDRTRRVLEHWGRHQGELEEQKTAAADAKERARNAAAATRAYQQGLTVARQQAAQSPGGTPIRLLDERARSWVSPELLEYLPPAQNFGGGPDPDAVGPFDYAHPTPQMPEAMYFPENMSGAKRYEQVGGEIRSLSENLPDLMKVTAGKTTATEVAQEPFKKTASDRALANEKQLITHRAAAQLGNQTALADHKAAIKAAVVTGDPMKVSAAVQMQLNRLPQNDPKAALDQLDEVYGDPAVRAALPTQMRRAVAEAAKRYEDQIALEVAR